MDPKSVGFQTFYPPPKITITKEESLDRSNTGDRNSTLDRSGTINRKASGDSSGGNERLQPEGEEIIINCDIKKPKVCSEVATKVGESKGFSGSSQTNVKIEPNKSSGETSKSGDVNKSGGTSKTSDPGKSGELIKGRELSKSGELCKGGELSKGGELTKGELSRSGDKLDAVIESISHDLDYLLNREVEDMEPSPAAVINYGSLRRMSKHPPIIEQVEEEEAEEEKANEIVTGILRTKC